MMNKTAAIIECTQCKYRSFRLELGTDRQCKRCNGKLEVITELYLVKEKP